MKTAERSRSKAETGQGKTVAEGLARLLADSYALYLKTQNCHWNVTGPLFPSLHAMFEAQYKELAEAADEIAERLRALGFRAPASFSEFSQLASVKEESGLRKAGDMVLALLRGHETATQTAREVILFAEEAGDPGTVDLAVERMRAHEKAAWMLRSTGDNGAPLS